MTRSNKLSRRAFLHTLGGMSGAAALGSLMLAFDGFELPPEVGLRLAGTPAAGVTLFRYSNVSSPTQVRALTSAIQDAARQALGRVAGRPALVATVHLFSRVPLGSLRFDVADVDRTPEPRVASPGEITRARRAVLFPQRAHDGPSGLLARSLQRPAGGR